MLRKILSVTGRPGLFKLLSQSKGAIIVEELGTGRRFPLYGREKIVSLGDIAMYTESGDTPLGEILDKVYAAKEGNPIDIKALAAVKGGLKDEFGKIIEDFDRDRVHDGDVKKLFQWYNLLTANGFDKFAEEEATVEGGEESAEAETAAE